MPMTDWCHVRTALARVTTELEQGRSTGELEAVLCAERKLWRAFNHHVCENCKDNAEMRRLAGFVLGTLEDGCMADDRDICALISVNSRAYALLMRQCTRRTERLRPEPLSADQPLTNCCASGFGTIFDIEGMQHGGHM